MAKANGEWAVLPHGPIEQLAENLRWVWGSLSGLTLKRNMTMVRLDDGGLLIHNGVALNDAGMTELEAFGTPKYLVVPSQYHRLDAVRFKQRYPQLKVYAPRNARAVVEKLVAVDGSYEDFPKRDDVRFESPSALGGREGVMLVRSNDGTTVVLNDAVFNMDKKQDFLGNLFTTLLGSAPGPRVSRLAKATIIKDKKSFRADLERLAALPDLARVIVAHEKVASGADAAAALRTAATFL
jgi:hypothetical protein